MHFINVLPFDIIFYNEYPNNKMLNEECKAYKEQDITFNDASFS